MNNEKNDLFEQEVTKRKLEPKICLDDLEVNDFSSNFK